LIGPAAPLDERTAAQLAALFRAFSDTSRVCLIAALADCEKNVSALAELVGISESAVSHRLRGLRQMRLVRARKAGRQVYYCLDDDHIAALFRQGLDHVRLGVIALPIVASLTGWAGIGLAILLHEGSTPRRRPQCPAPPELPRQIAPSAKLIWRP
jgi:DNA-binding transcriptional ArsR family regulator